MTSVAEGGRTYTVVFPDGTSVNPGYRLVKNPSYRGIADDYRRTFETLAALKPDIWLTPHTEPFAFDAKRARAATEGVSAWVDPDGYRTWVDLQRKKFDAAIAKEKNRKPDRPQREAGGHAAIASAFNHDPCVVGGCCTDSPTVA